MKSLRARFLIPFALLAVFTSIFVFRQVYELSRKHANELIGRQADMALEFNLAIRDYAAKQIRPTMERLIDKDAFMPETMSTSLISRAIFEEVRKKFPNYVIRFSSENPRNPVNMATPDELRMIDYFRRNPQVETRSEEVQINGERYLAYFTPKWMTTECIRCHGDPKDAPAELVERYGATASFYRKVGDVAGLDTVAIPLEAINAPFVSEVRSQLIILGLGLALLFGAIFLVFRFVVTRRLEAMAGHFNEIAVHAESPWMTPVEVKGCDEISVLGVAFNKLIHQLRATHASLEMRVSQRTEELRKANQRLLLELAERKQAESRREALEAQLRQAQKMEAIGTLAGGIAHDFNNILAAIIGYTEMVITDLSALNPMRRDLEQVLKAGYRARDLVKQILVFSRMKTGETHQGVDVGRVVEEVLKFLRASLPSTIEIHHQIETQNGMTLGDPTQIHELLMNLCTNAAHAMEDNGGVLEVSLSDVELDAKKTSVHPDMKPGPYLSLTVSDTGHGMDAEVMEHIFEPYFTTKEVGKGTGFGLAVVHGIVKRHGGVVVVQSKPGNGTTFKIYLPSFPHGVGGPGEAEGLVEGGTESILFVDDEEALADMAQRMLNQLGYRVCACTSSMEALRVFRADPYAYDLVITDYTMPQMTGADLAREMLDIRSDIPVILCTGYSERITEEKADEMGVREFLMKPASRGGLAAVIRKILGTETNERTDTRPQGGAHLDPLLRTD